MSATNYGADQDEDVCGLCGEPGADKIAHPVLWPGERRSETGFVHAACEQEECGRAHREFMQKAGKVGVDNFLRNL